MKSAVIFTSVAAMVGALPHCQPGTVEANSKKLPFIQSGKFAGMYCGMSPGTWFAHTDKNCGTERFCQAFNDQQKMRDYLQAEAEFNDAKAEPEFKNAKDCFDAHEPRSS